MARMAQAFGLVRPFSSVLALVLLRALALAAGSDGLHLNGRPHVKALPALSVQLLAAEREANATEAEIAHCAAELKAERAALERTRQLVGKAEKDVAKGKDKLRRAEARRVQLTPVENVEKFEDAIKSFTERVQDEEKDIHTAKDKLMKTIGALKAHKVQGLSKQQVAEVKAELNRIENRTRAWEADKGFLTQAMHQHASANFDRTSKALSPDEAKLSPDEDELRELEEVVIPAVRGSISEQEDVVASMMAKLNSTRWRLRACLARHAHADKHASAGNSTMVDTDSNSTVAEEDARASLDAYGNRSSDHAEQNLPKELHHELSVDEPYKYAPAVDVKNVAAHNASLRSQGGINGSTGSFAAAVVAAGHGAKAHAKGPLASLKATLAAPLPVVETLRGAAAGAQKKGTKKGAKATLPAGATFGERLAGLFGR